MGKLKREFNHSDFDEYSNLKDKLYRSCNDCNELADKLVKTEKEYHVKKRGASFIRDSEAQQKQLDQLDSVYGNKIENLQRAISRFCKDK